MKSQKELSIIIVNWNSGMQLTEVVASVAENHQNLVKSVIIVDNASTDNSLAQVESLLILPFKLRIIRNPVNRGFAAACNQGAALAEGKYLLFLNPDTRLFENSLSEPLAYLEDPAHQKVGIVGIQLLDERSGVSRSCARFPSPFGFVAHAVGIDRLFPRLGHFMAEWDHSATREVDHVIGAFLLVRRNLFETLHGFDERFFVYLEDLDFSCRASKVGWKSVYLSDAQAFHAGGGTSRQVKSRRLFYSLRSRLLYSHKHFGFAGMAVVFAATLLIEPFSRVVWSFSTRSLQSVRETCHAYVLLLSWLTRWISKGEIR